MVREVTGGGGDDDHSQGLLLLFPHYCGAQIRELAKKMCSDLFCSLAVAKKIHAWMYFHV